MPERVACEFRLIRYVPDPVKGEFANIGVVLRPAGESGGQAAVRFTRDWSRVRCLHPDADVEMLEALEGELNARLALESTLNASLVRESTLSASLLGESAAELKTVLGLLEDTLSNSLQISPSRGTLAESLPAEMELLLRMYVEPLKVKAARRAATGRTAIAGRMRAEFERAGAWALMRKRVPAREYTQPGDPLKIDCGYRNGRVRLFHAVSLEGDAELAKSLAFSAPALREGVRRGDVWLRCGIDGAGWTAGVDGGRSGTRGGDGAAGVAGVGVVSG